MPGLRVSERLYSKRIITKELACHPPAPEINEAHVEMNRVSAAARRQRKYRERLKQDPDRCKQMRAKDAERGRIYRKSLGELDRARQREQTRLRQQRLRERRKENGIVTEAARRQREYRERLKQDPGCCKQMHAKGAENSRICRKSLGEEKRARQRELARLRQQRLRERRKEGGINTEAVRRQHEYQDPDHCKQICAKEAECSRICRKSLGEENRVRQREQTRLRQQQLREGRKESGIHRIVTEAARRQREYRKHRRQNSDHCKQICAKEAEHSRICRKSLGEEKRARQRELARLRQQRLRERRKEGGIVTEAARRQREYQEHQKQDPDHCKQLHAKEAENSRICRKSVGEKNRARQREQTRLRQQQLREGRKESGNGIITEAARRQHEYRERLKQDPDRCKQMRAKEAERGRIYRKSLGEENRARMREQTRLRQQRLRERRKESGIVTEASKKPGTRASLEAKREKDRLRQQKYRANMSEQKKTAVCMRRKQLRDIRKMETLCCSSPLPNASSTPS